MVAVILMAQVMNVAGADERAAHLARDPHDPFVGAVLRGDAVVLDFEVDVLGAERANELVDVGAGLILAAVGKPPRETRSKATGEGDQPFAVAVDLSHVDGWLAALEPFEEAVGTELHEVAVASVAGGEQRQVVVLVLATDAGFRLLGVVNLAAENRLDSVLITGLVVLNRTVHHAVIGQREG